MRRFLSLVFAYAFAGQAWAQNFTIDNLNYEVINAQKHYVSVSKTEIEIKDNLVIPSEVVNDGITYTVVSIADNAFSGCSELTSVDIPKSVTSIGRFAFYGCRGLTTITISVTNVYEEAFRDCSGLTSVVIHSGNIEKAAFSGCSNLTSITLPYYACGNKDFDPNINHAYEYPFGYIFGELEYDGGVRTSQIYYYYYYGWGADPNASKNKKKDSVTYYIPANLKEIIITGGGNSFDDFSIPDGAFSYCKSITSITIKDYVKIIGECAFKGCESLESIDIPNSVRGIGDEAFYDCCSLTSVTLLKSVGKVGNSAFRGCNNLTIYCEVKEEPATWHYKWNVSNRPVVWGDKSIPCRKYGHQIVTDNAVAATCTKSGETEGSHCSVCGEVFVKQEKIPALGHEFSNYIYNNDATTTADGTETATCLRCGETDTRVAQGTKLATSVSESAADNLQVHAHGNTIIVENATEEIRVYDAMGRLICRDAAPCVHAEMNVNATGVYIVKVGNVAKRVMVN
ncbi:MAG: leucine-rich repeat domain-containing protein [Salinivirgaceae bacterium]|nr:leucine-rich repeat domain-containing protein [Salinivirgaceae bacterium]